MFLKFLDAFIEGLDAELFFVAIMLLLAILSFRSFISIKDIHFKLLLLFATIFTMIWDAISISAFIFLPIVSMSSGWQRFIPFSAYSILLFLSTLYIDKRRNSKRVSHF